MHRALLLSVTVLGLVGCSAPKGQKLAADPSRKPTLIASAPRATSGAGLAPVASGPANVELGPENENAVVGLYPNATITVTLPAVYRGGYTWRMAEQPDPSVLRLVSREFSPGESPRKPGTQTLTFEATGIGDVPVKLRYGTVRATSQMGAFKPYDFIVTVAPEPPAAPAKKSKKKSAE